MVVAITLLGILSGVVAVFLPGPIKAYVEASFRASLTDAADGALRRISRDVAAALPNSFRSTSAAGGSNSCFEFLPVVAGGRYRYQASSSGGGDILNFATADTSFEVLGQVRLGDLPAGTHQVVIYNLGIPGADAYAGDNTATISGVDTTTTPAIPKITLSAGKQFPFESPGKVFQVIPGYSVVYSCPGDGTLYRATRAISSGKMASCAISALSNVTALVANVTSCNFYYVPAVNQRDGILSVSLELTQNAETVRLYTQVMVNNAP